MKIPKNWEILDNPQIIIDFILNGGWIYEKYDKQYLYDGGCFILNNEEVLYKELFNIFKFDKFIEIDSGNFDYGESYYRLNLDKEYDIHKIYHFMNELFNHYEFRDKYKNDFRKVKFKKLINE